MSDPSSEPRVLWDQATREHPDDPEGRDKRYHELMVEHGHIVKRQPGQSRNLPCGWPHLPEAEEVPCDVCGAPGTVVHEGRSSFISLCAEHAAREVRSRD